jgi:ubiquinone/menaquinone biosynthesis C-methylase UbiE
MRFPPLTIFGRKITRLLKTGRGIWRRLRCESRERNCVTKMCCRSVAAVDFSAGMVEKARVNVTAENVRFIEGDIQLGWQFADASFDFIVCTLVLEHIENLRHVFAEARRVLREGGEFWLYELHPFRQMQGGQAQFKSDNGTTTLITAYLHSVSEFVNTAIEAGFEIVRLDEWRDGDDAANNLSPRLLSLNVRVS